MAMRGKILITGGSGTLGRAIVTLAEREEWRCDFTIFSRSELLQAKMRSKFPKVRYVLGDVRDANAVNAAVAGHDVVIHAAAMKRVPECEVQPLECFLTNVQGSHNVAVACSLQGIKRCIGISTDKAVRATTVYGASKLTLEQIWRAQSTFNGTAYTLVRYGNVVASRGSVISLWRDQVAQEQPLTVTDKRMTRFWMSPFDAVRLIEQACTLAHGQIIVPKMKSLSIEALAQLIAPGSEIVEQGFRSAEKLHEDLIHPDEKVQDAGPDYIVGTKSGRKGITYTSKSAESLSAAEIATMIADAEALEW